MRHGHGEGYEHIRSGKVARSAMHASKRVQPRLLIGQTLVFKSDPFNVSLEEATEHSSRGAILIDNSRIVAIGSPEVLAAMSPSAFRQDFGDALILPGFIDAHAHYPQTGIIASWGARLIDWLQEYTFPEEARFGDPDLAAEVANRYLDTVIANGTTTVCSFCTTHPESVVAFFEASLHRNMRVVAGKTCMDRNAPENLLDNARDSYGQSRRLLSDWHGKERLGYAITPRFAPTSSPEQLEALGSLWSEFPDCLMQTHICEQIEEIEWVRELFPSASDYLDVYESFGLLGAKGLYGHAIHLNMREAARLKEAGGALVHCPTSNVFIGSGLFDLADRKSEGHRVGLATDTGGGSSFSMLRTMAAAYEIGQLRGQALHPAQLLWIATQGNAEILGLEKQIGSLEAGKEADIVVLDLKSTAAIAQRADRANDIWEAVFPTIMMGDDRAVLSVWVNGGELVSRSRSN